MKRIGILLLIALSVACTNYAGEFVYNELSVSPLLKDDPWNTYAFHLQNRAQKAFYSGAGAMGADLNMLQTIEDGITGAGVRVCVSDMGVDAAHEDLAANELVGDSTNYGAGSATDPNPIAATDDHGTPVAGIIVALADNGKGSRGVAPNAHWAAKNFISDSVTQTTLTYIDQPTGNFDVFNYSWGSNSEYDIEDIEPLFETALSDGITNSRAGKGAIYLKAAGNSYVSASAPYRHVNANIYGDNNLPYWMVVGGVSSLGYKASYASTGSSLWISGITGEFGYPNVVTTDRTGCSVGYGSNNYPGYGFPSVQTSANAFNPTCSYIASFNGTSAATPTVAGVVALMLEANPALTWRDVKHILASTARKIDARTSYSNEFVTSPSGHVWERGWVTNAAGFSFHNYYGFGLVDTDAAVEMSKTYVSTLGTFTSTGGGAGAWDHARTGLALAIPDNSATGVTDTMTVVPSFTIEAVQIRLNVTHFYPDQVGIEITSPAGTKSIVSNVNNSLLLPIDLVDAVFLTNAFYGESTAGNWKVKLVDGKASDTGTLTSWELRFFGHY